MAYELRIDEDSLAVIERFLDILGLDMVRSYDIAWVRKKKDFDFRSPAFVKKINDLNEARRAS